MSGGTWAVSVAYESPTSRTKNTFGTFRSERAAERFADAVRAWDDSRPDAERGEVYRVTTRVFPVTKPLLEFVQEDVARLSEVVIIGGSA